MPHAPTRRALLQALGAAAVLPLGARAARAGEATLTIGMGGAVTSMDPQFHRLATNNDVARHVFERLIDIDAMGRLVPQLATAWTVKDGTLWEFTLRRGVTFGDGSPFDAADVVATLARAPRVPQSPAPFVNATGLIAETTVPDPYTIRFRTTEPTALLPYHLTTNFIINRRFAEAATADFNSGPAMVGTGPYRFEAYKPGELVSYTRRPDHWAGAQPWARVTVRFLTNPAQRVAALRTGAVDLIDSVPVADIPELKQLAGLRLASSVAAREVYLTLNQHDTNPYATDRQGKPLPRNPLQDLRVRRALSKAINRAAITERVMASQGIPAGQFLPDGFYGTSPNLKPDAFDPAGAKALLAEAGYPDGFGLMLLGPNDRYINDAQVLQAVGQMFSRIGVAVQVETMPFAVYAPKVRKAEYGAALASWGASGTWSYLPQLVATQDKARGLGVSNSGGYSNPALDRAIDQALRTFDDAERGRLLAAACETAFADLPQLPLHFEISTWAMAASVAYDGRSDQVTWAGRARPA